MIRTRTLPLALVMMLLAACSSENVATTGEGAASGRGYGEGLTPVESRTVWVGRNQDRRADACTRRVTLRDNSTVYWAPPPTVPRTEKANVSGEVLACDTAEGWTGIIFGGNGLSLADCNLARRIAGPTEYQGPCRWGWVPDTSIRG